MHTAARGMEPLTIDRTHILVLNYNGRGLLAECLPSIVLAADDRPFLVASPSSTTVRRTAQTSWSQVVGPLSAYVREANHGLASFNRVLERLDEPVVLLLNNDVKLDPGAVGPLLEVFETP